MVTANDACSHGLGPWRYGPCNSTAWYLAPCLGLTSYERVRGEATATVVEQTANTFIGACLSVTHCPHDSRALLLLLCLNNTLCSHTR